MSVTLSQAQPMRTVLETFTAIPEGEWDFFIQRLQMRTIESKDYFLQEGEDARYFGLVTRGFFKKFYRDTEGNEFIKEFCTVGELMGPYSAYLTNEPSRINFQALEPSAVLCLPCSDMEVLYARHSCWQICGRKIAETLFIERERREYEFLMLSAEERYEALLGRFPHLSDRVPQYLLASYLGITPVALSRIVSRRRGL